MDVEVVIPFQYLLSFPTATLAFVSGFIYVTTSVVVFQKYFAQPSVPSLFGLKSNAGGVYVVVPYCSGPGGARSVEESISSERNLIAKE